MNEMSSFSQLNFYFSRKASPQTIKFWLDRSTNLFRLNSLRSCCRPGWLKQKPFFGICIEFIYTLVLAILRKQSNNLSPLETLKKSTF